jgi:MerR family mercuric resistance operon transcriptional regulator
MKTVAKARNLTIGRLAAATAVNLETVRYYERVGLMSPPARTAGGHRVYDDHHVRRLTFIRRSRELGFSIENIRALLALTDPKRRSCASVQKIASTHLIAVRDKLADLKRLEKILSQTVVLCSGQTTPVCPVLDMLGAEN